MKCHHRLAALLLLLTALVFADLPSQQFLFWDDNGTITENQRLQPPSVGNMLYFWSHPHMDLYVPVTYTAWSAVAAVAQRPRHAPGAPPLSPAPFKSANLLLHLGAVLVVFALLRRLVKNDWAAFTGALLYGIHPVQVEPVAWISGLKDVLCGLFSLLALWQYLQFAEQSREETPGRHRWLHYGAALAAFALALMTKPVAMALPAAAAALDLWAARRPLPQVLKSLAPWLALALPWMLVTRHFQPAPGVGETHPLWTRPFVAGDALAFYLYHTALPLQLAADYGRTPEWVMRHPWAYVAWLLPAALAVVLWRVRKRNPLLLAAAGVSLCAVLPILGFVPFDFQHFSTVSDHYLYLAMFGPALALAWWLSSRPTRAYAPVALALLLLGGQSILQTYHWANNRAFFSHIAEVNPRSWMAHCGLGSVLEAENNWDQAGVEYRQALALNRDDLKSCLGLANVLDATGHHEEAIQRYCEVLSRDPNRAGAHLNLGVTLGAVGRLAEAEREFAEAARLQPNLWLAHYNLGNTRARRGDRMAARAEYEEALRYNPGSAEIRGKLAGLQATPD